jgi:hypothetical protein
MTRDKGRVGTAFQSQISSGSRLNRTTEEGSGYAPDYDGNEMPSRGLSGVRPQQYHNENCVDNNIELNEIMLNND